MPIINRIGVFAPEMAAWRQHLHAHPELSLECHQTAAFVLARLRDFGITEIHEGIATSGVVALIDGQGDGPTIGLRADMDALPIHETTGAPYASKTPGVAHSCGHDGHTTMLLGAAKYLAETRNFKGRVALIFQPAEESVGGGRIMVEEGILDTFDIAQVYALHCDPEIAEGLISTTPGRIMAAVDDFFITVTGQGGHGAYPYEAVDPIPPALTIAQAFSTIVSRNVRAKDELVISVTMIAAGTATNVIPETVTIAGTVRTFDVAVQDMVRKRMAEIVAGQAAAFGCSADLDYRMNYPATINDAAKTEFATSVARGVVGEAATIPNRAPDMGAEDFSYFLNERPGCYAFLGQGIGPFCHHPAFNFNDAVAPIGASYFARLVEKAHPL
jgi:amidohydrolase